MKREQPGRLLIIALLLALPILWVYFAAEMRDVRAERQLNMALSALHQRDAELITDLLRSRSHIDNHFDHLSQAQLRMQQTMTALRQVVVAPALQISEQLQQVDRLVAGKLGQVERFKSLHAKLSNSLRYLPKLSRSIVDAVASGALTVPPELVPLVEDIVKTSLSLRVFDDPLRLTELKQQRARLVTLLAQQASVDRRLQRFAEHTRLLLEVRLAEMTVVDTILNDQLSAELATLENQLDRLHDQEITKTLQIKYFLLAYVVLLFVIIAIFIINRYRLLAQSQQHKSLSERDQLTQLHNRRYFLAQLEQALSIPPGESLGALLFIDLDGFKAVNDEYGHGAGDGVLRDIAGRLQQQADEQVARGALHAVARLGGDEFVIWLEALPRASADVLLRNVADEALRLCARPLKCRDTEVSLSASIGIALFGDEVIALSELLHRADQAMYRAKREGKNGYCLYQD